MKKNCIVLNSLIYIIAFSVSLCIFSSCSQVRKTEAEKEREAWIEGFTDSIEYYQKQKELVQQNLDKENNSIASLMQQFEMVRNPREVSGYYIYKGWNNRLPFTSTGIYARINENEKLEMIATLGGATFNKIGVGEGSDVFFTETVPHDQAFNYRHERYNTVYFSGGKADTVAMFIYNHRNENPTIYFYEGNKKYPYKLPSEQKSMISETWQLYEAQLNIRKLQKELWICSKKIETFRRIMEMQNMKEEN